MKFFCCSRLKLSSSEMRKVIATLRALVEVMELLSKDADPSGVGGLIMEEVLLVYYFRMSINRKINLINYDLIIHFSVVKLCFDNFLYY